MVTLSFLHKLSSLAFTISVHQELRYRTGYNKTFEKVVALFALLLTVMVRWSDLYDVNIKIKRQIQNWAACPWA